MKSGVYTEVKAEEFLKTYVPIAKHSLVKNFEQATIIAKKLGFPLVLKIISQDAIHKSEIKGVRIVKNRQDLSKEFEKLVSIAKEKKLRLEGILVQEYVEGEYVIIGLKKDVTFGHVIAFGIGGIYTELLKDISFRVCPITSKDAEEMFDELKLRKLLEGFRNTKAINKEFLKKTLIKVSQIPLKHPEIQEMDINPFVINEKDGKVVDARILVE
jgi:acyl-CoA synthetase (NDP forming)